MYKLIYKNRIIDVVARPRFVKFLASGTVSFADRAAANGIVGSDNETLYSFETVARPNVKVITIESITEEEFKRLQSLLNSETVVYVSDNILPEAKIAKINELSNLCKATITAGFNIKLSDGEYYHFKLTQEDQLNLMMLENQLAAGAKTVVYHATDKPCQAFSYFDMETVIKAYKAHVLYHTTYFNIAKQYINSLKDLDAINTFTYGTDVTDFTNVKSIKRILKGGGRL